MGSCATAAAAYPPRALEWSTAAPRRRANVAAIRRPLLTFTASPVTTSCDSRSAYVAELTEHRKAHGLPGFPRLPGVPGDFRGGRPWPQPTGDRYLLWGSVASCLCQGTQDTTRTPSPSCLALAEWHICQPVISSKLKGDTALCSGKPEETTNSKYEGLARDLDSFFHTRRRQHHRTSRARRSRCACRTWR